MQRLDEGRTYTLYCGRLCVESGGAHVKRVWVNATVAGAVDMERRLIAWLDCFEVVTMVMMMVMMMITVWK